MNQYFVPILTSTVIATLITAAISIFTLYKNSKLKYITEERSKWRAQIRNIMVEIDSANENNIHRVITKLKSRINAYGYAKPNDVLHDGHIWRTINCIENHNSDFKELKNELILYLSFLLKYDWEKSKKEVLGNVIKIFGIGATLFYYIYYFYHSSSYVYWGIFTYCPLFILIPIGVVKLAILWIMNNKNKSFFYVIGILILAIIEIILGCYISRHFNRGLIEDALLVYPTTLLTIAYMVEEIPKIKYTLHLEKLEKYIIEK